MNAQNQDFSIMGNNNLVRYDRNISNNLLDFKTTFGEHSSMAQDLLVFLSFKTQHQNLFGQIEFDPIEFANAFKYSKAYLIRNLDLPKKELGAISVLDENSKHYMSRRIEHVLYLLASRNIVFSGKAFITDSNEERVDIDFLQVIKKIVVIQKRTDVRMTDKNNTKRKYYIELNEQTIKNFLNWYMPVDISVLPDLRKPGIYDLYIYMKHLMAFNLPENYMDFDMLCNILDIKEDSPPAYKKKRINTKLKTLKEKSDINFLHKWEKSGKQRFSYKLKIAFLEDKYQLKTISEGITKQNKEWFNNRVIKAILNEYNKGKIKQNMFKWINKAETKVLIEKIYREVHDQLFSKEKFSEYKMKSIIPGIIQYFENNYKQK